MDILITLIAALFFGTIAYFVTSITPFKEHAYLVGVIVALAVFLVRLGVL